MTANDSSQISNEAFMVNMLSMMTSRNGDIFRVTGLLNGEFIDHRWIPLTKASDAELWCSLICALNKRLSKISQGWWFETPSRPLRRHCNVNMILPVSGLGGARVNQNAVFCIVGLNLKIPLYPHTKYLTIHRIYRNIPTAESTWIMSLK